jgi:hypothetical protein
MTAIRRQFVTNRDLQAIWLDKICFIVLSHSDVLNIFEKWDGCVTTSFEIAK